MNDISLPHEKMKIETFEKKIYNPEILPLLFYLLQSRENQELLLRSLKDINVLILAHNGANVKYFLEFDGWQLWFFPLMLNIPSSSDELSQIQRDICNYITNALAMIHHYIFANAINVKLEINHTFDILTAFTGWSYGGCDYGRVIIRALISKISSNILKWKKDYLNKEFDSLNDVISVVEEYLFFRPINYGTDYNSDGDSMMMYFDRSRLESSAELQRCVSIHLDLNSKCQDAVLGQKISDLLKSLGFNAERDEVHDSNFAAMDKRIKARVRQGDEHLFKFSHMFNKFFENVDAGAHPSSQASLIASFIEEKEKKNILSIGTRSKSDAKQSVEAFLVRQEVIT